MRPIKPVGRIIFTSLYVVLMNAYPGRPIDQPVSIFTWGEGEMRKYLSNRFNPTLADLTLVEIYVRIQGVTDIAELSALLNYVKDNSSNPEAYDGYHDSKFYKVNFTSLAKHSTVEFRQPEGTVSAKSAIGWAKFIIRFVEYAINASDDTIMTGGNTIDDLAHLVRLP
ncbi:hypothetical protein DXG01_001580 [Tephrocybe rancida]|nr:hypothetical protein DXG01_001580 [Tephrocybe rancida]